MKKNLLALMLTLFLALLLAGCGGLFNPERASFSPPEWIQGTWSDTLDAISFTFTTDDIITLETSFKDLYSLGRVTENESSVLYDVKITLLSVNIGNYVFEKTSATTLDFMLITDEDSSEAVELIKQ
ncbi:MAG: hypothetical protein PHX07_01385 [Candidatus Marinimicrobia bacterium]|nr:hypothetical protein [Candidatus Neomarinimicrobiota bacterium]